MKNFGKDTIFTGQEIRKTSKSIFYNIHLDKLLPKDAQIVVLSIGFGCFKRRIGDVRGGWMQSALKKNVYNVTKWMRRATQRIWWEEIFGWEYF